MSSRVCKVSFRRMDGAFHSVDVEADTVYEAVLIALSSLSPRERDEGVEASTRVNVQVFEPGPRHIVAVAEVRRWLERPSEDAAELAAKRKLRGLLAS
jgi:hypothetical protein